MPMIDITGQTFNRFLVLGRAGARGAGKKTVALWAVRCECGTEKIVDGHSLKRGTTKSCGCLFREVCAAKGKVATRTHGLRHSPEYSTFYGARSRCNNPLDKCYHLYGGRGIQFKFKTFEEFFSELGPRPGANYSIDRIDNNGDYEPGNVRWATASEQQRNRRPFRIGRKVA